ncbi:MAG: hypothetical protein ACKO96_16355 [Flammeovirgaceae bacterium]
MKWIVIKEDPKPDQYIPVIVTDENKFLGIEKRPCYVFKTSEEAMNQARALRKEFNVTSIRIFYTDTNPL